MPHNPIHFVTLPRSGHHWLVRTIKQCCTELPEDWHIDTHTTEPTEGTCAFKTHDLALGYTLPKGHALVVQWRDPLPALVSWFEFGIKSGDWPDTRDAWIKFASQRVKFIGSFHAKWMQDPAVVIDYDDLLKRPLYYAEGIAGAIDTPFDPSLYVAETPPKPRRVESFRYYNEATFDCLEILIEMLT